MQDVIGALPADQGLSIAPQAKLALLVHPHEVMLGHGSRNRQGAPALASCSAMTRGQHGRERPLDNNL